MNRLFFCLFIILILAMIQSCATTTKNIMRQDSLIGKMINTKTGQTIDLSSLIKKIGFFDVIYLSEKHDNPEHHNMQQKIIHGLIEAGQNPSIGFEFFSMNNTPDMLNYVDSGKVDHSKKIEKIIEADLRGKLRWNNQSDEMWKFYYDLLKIAQKEKLNVAGIDLSGSLKKRITRKGIDSIAPIEKEMVFSTHLSDTPYKEYMYSVFKAVHCGMGNEKMQSKLYDTWTARNDKMALSITQLVKHSNDPVIIIIGGGHTEYGLGVINRVEAIDKNISQVNISLQEISVNPSDMSKYLEPLELKGFEPVLPADYIYFTQRVSYKNPCLEFAKSLKRMKSHKQKSKDKP